MTSISKARIPHQKHPTNTHGGNFGAKQICLIVGLVCLAGFMVDMLAIGMPPSPFDLPWRVSFLQQTGDRSITLLFGFALLLYSQLGNRRLLKPLSLICLGIGVAFMLSCILVVRDSLILQDQAFSNISTQAEQLRDQVESSRNSPNLPAEITAEQFEQFGQQIASQADQLKQNTRSGITKAGLASIGNLILIGLGLVSLGRFGLTGARRAPKGR